MAVVTIQKVNRNSACKGDMVQTSIVSIATCNTNLHNKGISSHVQIYRRSRNDCHVFDTGHGSFSVGTRNLVMSDTKKLEIEKRNQKLIEQAKETQRKIRESIEQIRKNSGLDKGQTK